MRTGLSAPGSEWCVKRMVLSWLWLDSLSVTHWPNRPSLPHRHPSFRWDDDETRSSMRASLYIVRSKPIHHRRPERPAQQRPRNEHRRPRVGALQLARTRIALGQAQRIVEVVRIEEERQCRRGLVARAEADHVVLRQHHRIGGIGETLAFVFVGELQAQFVVEQVYAGHDAETLARDANE